MLATSIALLLMLAPSPSPSPEATSDPDNVELAGGLKLTRTGGGGFRYEDKDAGFTAEIAFDGSVRFRDRHAGPQKGRVSVLGFDLVRKGQREPLRAEPFRPDIVPYGPYKAPPILGSVGGRMGGAADAKASARRYTAKQRFLELTESLRAELREQARDKVTREALFELSHQLLQIWNDRRLPLSVRKERVFAAWDDCSEPERSEKADEHPGARARLRIEQFIRIHAKQGSDDGFTDAELRDFNGRRKSREKFAPYRTTTR